MKKKTAFAAAAAALVVGSCHNVFTLRDVKVEISAVDAKAIQTKLDDMTSKNLVATYITAPSYIRVRVPMAYSPDKWKMGGDILNVPEKRTVENLKSQIAWVAEEARGTIKVSIENDESLNFGPPTSLVPAVVTCHTPWLSLNRLIGKPTIVKCGGPQ